MKFAEFAASVGPGKLPAGLTPALQAVWYGAGGNWDAAHGIVQELESSDAAWVHAWLHRIEGDESNAGYWYRRAGREFCRTSTEEEWHQIAEYMLRK
jgi:hypothetical protein